MIEAEKPKQAASQMRKLYFQHNRLARKTIRISKKTDKNVNEQTMWKPSKLKKVIDHVGRPHRRKW